MVDAYVGYIAEIEVIKDSSAMSNVFMDVVAKVGILKNKGKVLGSLDGVEKIIGPTADTGAISLDKILDKRIVMKFNSTSRSSLEELSFGGQRFSIRS